MPDLSKEEVEWRLDRVYGDKVNGDTTAWEREELLQTALSLYARAEQAEQERDDYEAAVDEALAELGIPTMDYPANVTNAWAVLYALRHPALDKAGQP